MQWSGTIETMRLYLFQFADWDGIVPPIGNDLLHSLGRDMPSRRNRAIHDYARKIGEEFNKVKTGIGKVFKH
jgi:hypothetical protein